MFVKSNFKQFDLLKLGNNVMFRLSYLVKFVYKFFLSEKNVLSKKVNATIVK